MEQDLLFDAAADAGEPALQRWIFALLGSESPFCRATHPIFGTAHIGRTSCCSPYSSRILGSRQELDTAWSLIDEVLKVLLFLLIGFEILDITLHISSLTTMLVIIPLSVAARGLSVFLATRPMQVRRWDKGRRLMVLTWGGLRGGISVSLSLGLPLGEMRDLLLPICYGVVVSTIVVQGPTMERLARRLYPS
jgi:NhaP-type Na+/H+ or K+/H+ antiporter